MEKSLWQAEAELSRFDDDARVLKMQHERYASDLGAAKAQNTVLSHKDAFYSPEDPRADWSGMVPNQGTRKAVPGAEGGRMHIERTEEGGIVAAEDYHEQLPGGKKHYESDGRFQTEAQRQYPGHHVAGFGATGGGSSFVTSSQLAAQGAPTDHEFYGSSTKRRGKKQVRPAYENAGPYQQPSPILGGGGVPTTRGGAASMQRQPAVAKQPHRNGSLAGYRSRQFTAGAPSMLSTAASSIAQKIDSPDFNPDVGAMEWSHKKEIFDAGNFRSPGTIVGYTGRRPSQL